MISWQARFALNLDWSQLLKEYLIGCSFASLQKTLPPDASHLLNLLPITTQHIGKDLEVKVGEKTICVSQDMLWNTSMMLLSPQQRIVPYRSDMWIKLWDQLAVVLKGKQRFRPAQVVDKLRISLVCYQVRKMMILIKLLGEEFFYDFSQKPYQDLVLPCLQLVQ